MAPKILIVDDMPDAIDFLPEWFQREGYDVAFATQGQQALAYAEEMRPDVIILDTLMPGMGGIETSRRLKLNPATANIPVILISTNESAAAREECAQAGATDYITRPIQFEDLLARVKRLAHIDHDIPTDHVRLLKGMAYTALTVLPSNLAWILTVDEEDRWLEHQTVAIDHGAEAVDNFYTLIGEAYPECRFLLERGMSPFTQIVLDRRVLVNMQTEHPTELPHSAPLQFIFAEFGFDYISLLPLILAERVVGVMVLATEGAELIQSRRTQQILNSLTSQAAMAVDNARLIQHLAQRENQMQLEQTFRQLVLDAMGEGLIVVDAGAQITYVNNRMLRMSGYTREQLYGHSVGELFDPGTRAQLVESLIRRGKTFSFSQLMLTRRGDVVPVLISQVFAPAPNGEDEITIIVVTDISDLQRNEEALRIQTQRLRALNQAGNAISSANSISEVVQVTVESAVQIVNAETAVLLLRDRQTTRDAFKAVFAAGQHELAARTRRVMSGQGITGEVAAMGEGRFISDFDADGALRAEYEDVYGITPGSVLAVPLIAFDEVIGVVEVIDKVNGQFDEQDLSVLQSLAGAAAITIENTRLFEQTRRRVTELSTLLDASSAVTSTLDFGDILERIARRLSVALHVQRVVIANWERQTNRLVTLSELVNAYWNPVQGRK